MQCSPVPVRHLIWTKVFHRPFSGRLMGNVFRCDIEFVDTGGIAKLCNRVQRHRHDDWGASDMMTTSVTIGNGHCTWSSDHYAQAQDKDTLSCESIVTDPDGEVLQPHMIGVSMDFQRVQEIPLPCLQLLSIQAMLWLVPQPWPMPTEKVIKRWVVLPSWMNHRWSTTFPLFLSTRTFDTVTCAAMVSDDGSVDPTVTYLFENATTGTTLYPILHECWGDTKSGGCIA